MVMHAVTNPRALAPLALLLVLLAGAAIATAQDDPAPADPAAGTATTQPVPDDLAPQAAADPAPDEVLLPPEPQYEGDDADLAAADAASPSQEAAAKIQELRRNEYFYQSYGKADPFKVLVQGKYQQLESSDLVDIGSGHLVGIMWGPDDQFALVEDGNGFGYILRVGDPVQNGRVVSIRKNSLTAKITLYGITSTVTLKLEKTEG
jgi:hypothetical protein